MIPQTAVRSSIAPTVRGSWGRPLATCRPKASSTSTVAAKIASASAGAQRRRAQRFGPAQLAPA